MKMTDSFIIFIDRLKEDGKENPMQNKKYMELKSYLKHLPTLPKFIALPAFVNKNLNIRHWSA